MKKLSSKIAIALSMILILAELSAQTPASFKIVKADTLDALAEEPLIIPDSADIFLSPLLFWDPLSNLVSEPSRSNINYEVIDLSDQDLRTIPFDYVTYRWVAKYDLSNNRIRRVSRRFGKLSTDTLILANNSVKEFGPASFYRRLVYLDVSNNALSEIPGELTTCRRMRYADFSGNHIEQIPSLFFPLYMESLLLASNKLHDLPNRLRSLDYLRALDLHNNSFEKIPRVIYEIESLEYLDLSYNMIEKVTPRFARLPNLLVLDLRGNPLDPESVDRLRSVMPKGCDILFDDPIALKKE
jgi:Leucine-rich repeat (LRR) protein